MGLISCLLLQLILVLNLQTLIVLSQNIVNGYVPVGESLNASESQQFTSSWRSPNGDFPFGFRKIQPNDGFTLSIWFDKIRGKTIVWHAQTVNANTGLVPDGSRVTLTADRGLVLTDPRGQELWISLLYYGSVFRGRITDDGNFRLLSERTDDLWSTFANPTDTLLPNQSIELGGTLSSRRTETSFKKGRFRLSLRPNGEEAGDLWLLSLNPETLQDSDRIYNYYESHTNGPNPGIQLLFNQSGYLYVRHQNNSTSVINENMTLPKPSTVYYHRAVLHFDGVFAQYYHTKEEVNEKWILAWAEPDNICQKISGVDIGNMACGFNSVCFLDVSPNSNKRPRCECPTNFVLKDPNDKHGDCKPDFEIPICAPENNQTANSTVNPYEFITLNSTDWPTGEYMNYANYDEESCIATCLNDCLCTAVIYGKDIRVCSKKRLPLSYGQSNGNRNTFVKVLKRAVADVPITGKRMKNNDLLIIAFSVLFGTSAFVNFIFFALNRKKKKSKKMKKNQARDTGAVTATATANELNLRVFTYGELAAATGDFMDEVGRGSFGIVYKGFLKCTDDSEVTVAVKKLDRVAQENEKEFKNEVKVIGQIHHKNLVRLIGFCSEGKSRMIVYEFLPHGTLASFLFRRPRPIWKDRRRIAVDIARGILYLHEECKEQIIHCDIKPQNIILDEYYNPRISDFGLAKLLMMNQTHTLTNIRGTKGYVAPDWFRNSPITSKVDVYSYGVMLLEIVCCKKAVDLEDNVILIDWAYDCFHHGRLEDLIEGDLEAIEDMDTVERYVRIAIWCIQEEPGMRSNMRNVTQMLEGVAQVHDPPNPSPYSTISCYD